MFEAQLVATWAAWHDGEQHVRGYCDSAKISHMCKISELPFAIFWNFHFPLPFHSTPLQGRESTPLLTARDNRVLWRPVGEVCMVFLCFLCFKCYVVWKYYGLNNSLPLVFAKLDPKLPMHSGWIMFPMFEVRCCMEVLWVEQLPTFGVCKVGSKVTYA